ncbi:MAG: hypothetical protein AXW17_10275 [Colwellia sp. Phe_37]|nr:MAG: hypothetical protein AXW17_10275 [Colwellia sp. Phe_37]
MNTLSSTNAASLSAPTQSLSVREKNNDSLDHMKYVEKQLNSTSKALAEEKVTISEQALAMFRQDPAQAEKATSTSDSTNDKLLEKIKEQIEAVKQKLSRIKNDKGEAADQQRRQLQLQLATLNASMLDLLGKKLDAI